MKKLLGLLCMLAMSVMATEAKAEFSVTITSVTVVQFAPDWHFWVYVQGVVVDDPDGGADGIPLTIVDGLHSYLESYTTDCNEDGTFYFWFPFDAGLVADQVVIQANDWSVEYYDSDQFQYPYALMN